MTKLKMWLKTYVMKINIVWKPYSNF